MVKVQITPGPWKYDAKTGLIAHDEYDDIGFSPVATIHQPYESTPERVANAQLIAAAPDMLAALEWWQAQMRDDNCDDMAALLDEMSAKAHAAITKAKGD